MRIETPRLIIRDLQESDIPALAALWSDPEVTRYMGGPRDFAAVAGILAEDLLAGHEVYDLRPVIDKASGQVIGDCGYLEKEVDGRREIELTYVLARSAWGKGLATEAASALRDYAFGALKLNRLIALIEPGNSASERVAQKIGMRLERETVRPGGAVRLVYAIELPTRDLKLYDGTQLPAMGLGTWSMGGRSRPDPSQDQRALQALAAAFAIGYTHIDTAEMYANGHAEELVGQALRGQDRQRFFLTTKVRPPNLSYRGTLQSIDGSLRRLGVEQIDLFLIHWRDQTPLRETFRALNEAVRAGKVRYLGVSNFDLADLQEAQALSETPIVTNQVPYSVATRSYVRNGVLPYCQQHGIVVTAYSPVEEGRLRVQAALAGIAAQHGATPYQIALAWLVQQPWVITIPMSHNPEHLQQNWDAAAIELTPEQMARLNGLA